jgi:thiol-disulfide isomerase/thioredoxin
MNGAMGSMMGWMMGFGWLAALLAIILLVVAIIALVRGMTQGAVAEKQGAGSIVLMVFAAIGVLVLVGVLAVFLMHGGMMTSQRGSPATGGETGGGFALRLRNPPAQIADFAFEDASGNKRSLANFRGRYVLLNVWATWCVPCREEMPALARLQQKLGGPEFEVVALSVDSGGADAVKRFFTELAVDTLKVYIDRSLQANAALSLVGIPTTVLIDPRGREVGRVVGPADWDSAEALDAIRRLTAGNQPERRVADGKSG